MSQPVEPTTSAENVGRGATFALLSIPISIAVFAIVAGFFGLVAGIIAIAIPFIAGWLYRKGAGAPLTRAGWAPFIVISAVAVILGTFSGIVAGAYHNFTRVGGDGGLLGSSFLTTLRIQLTTNIADNAFAIIIGLALGFAAISSVIRGRNAARTGGPGPLAQQNMPGGSPSVYPDAVAAPPAATPVAPTTPAAPTTSAPPLAPNQPSPGIILNGKPIEPDKR